MTTTKLSKVQERLVNTIIEYTKKNGHGLTLGTEQTNTVNALIKKGVVRLIESPFCNGNKLIELIK